MSGKLWVLLISVVLFGDSFAMHLRPYISGSVQYDVVFAHYGLRSATSSGWLHDFGCWGSQFDIGVKGKDLSVYFGYHYSASPMYGDMEHWYRDGYFYAASGINRNAWREKRYVLGSRWTMDSQGTFPVKPCVGIAVSYGNSRLDWNYLQVNSNLMDEPYVSGAYHHLRHSTWNLGTMIEFGFQIHAASMLDISIMTQAHRFESDFGEDFNTDTQDRYVVIMPSIQIGLQYLFPVMRIGE